MFLEGVEVRDGVAPWLPMPLGLEPLPPDVRLTAAEEDGLAEDDEFVDGVMLGAIEDAGMLKVDLLAGELPEGVDVTEDDTPTDMLTDKLYPVANPPQLLPAQESPESNQAVTKGPVGAGAAGIELAPPHVQKAPEATVLTVVIELVALHALKVEKHVVLHPWLEYAVLPPVAVMTPEQMALQSLAV